MRDRIELLLGGDFFPGRGTEDFVIKNPKKIWGNTLPLWDKCDFRVLNLETVVGEDVEAISKTGPHLHVPKETLNSLLNIDIDLVTLGNNHIRDYGDKGVQRTINCCQELGISYVGAGMNIEEAQRILFKTINEKKLAFINVAENEWNCASESQAGANPFDVVDIINQIKNGKKESDHVILIVHGGHEHYQYPNPKMVKTFHLFAEMGASAIVCHHTHCTCGYELYEGVPIFYGLGNLFFPNFTGLKTSMQGILLKLIITNCSIDFEIYPYKQCQDLRNPHIEMLEGEELVLFEKEFKELNRVLNNERLLREKWNKYIEKKTQDIITIFFTPTNLLRRIFNKLGLNKIIINKKMLLFRFNQIRCEAHSELTKAVFTRLYKKQ